MAHFAKISDDNVVLQVVVVANANTVNEEGAETESVGQAYLETHNNWPSHLWIKTSYNTENNQHKLGGTPFRGNYAGVGHTWDSSNEIFWSPKQYDSWTKDIASASWKSPLGNPPDLTSEQQNQNNALSHTWTYIWDESAYQSDNTTGWVLTNFGVRPHL
jgi:hypothetical protein|tara:strand:- start:259 stop:738 length:480 start_codon:yes stop_codon:yes gene_type:complete